jgi:chaperonin GroES
MVTGEDFVINYWAKSLDSAPRYTHILHYYPHEVKEKVAAGLWLDVRVEGEPKDAEDEDALVDFYEQHRYIDLDEDGHPEPYVVTTNKAGQVARIVPCFGADEVTVLDTQSKKPSKLTDIFGDGQDETAVDRIGAMVRIERRQYFTKYGFIPAPDGSFYDIGFGSLLEDLTASIDTSINQMLDAGSLQNAGGGFLGSGVNIRGGTVTTRLGEWKRIDVTSGTLRDNIFRMEHPGPSAVLFSLLGMLVEAAKEITSVQDVMTGEGTANQPATTTLALIEQGHKVMTAIFKRIHRAFGNELRILRRLNRDYLDEEEYFQLNDSPEPEQDENGQPIPQEPVRVGREDYQDADLDVVPVSDPSMASDMHKMARSEAEWTSFNGDPLVNQLELRRRRMETLGVRDIKKMLEVPPPAPDPKVLELGAKLALEKEKTGAAVRSSDAKAAELLTAAAERLALLGLLDEAAALAGAATELGGDIDDDSERGGVPAMEGQPPDAGVPEPAPEAAPGLEGPMGGGGSALPGAAGAGGDLGQAGGDQV